MSSIASNSVANTHRKRGLFFDRHGGDRLLWLPRRLVKLPIQRLGHHLHRSLASCFCVFATAVDHGTIPSLRVHTLWFVLEFCPVASDCSDGGLFSLPLQHRKGLCWPVFAMWRRPSFALAQEWRRAVPEGCRAMASVTSTEVGKCGGMGGDKGGKHIEVPLPMHGVAGKYAAALFLTAAKANALDPVRADMEQVAGVASMETLFSEFLRDPSVPKPARMKACEDIFKETKFHEVSKNFMAVLAENGRLSFMQHIYTSYCELLLAHRGDVEVQVTAALELSAAELEEIKKAVVAYLKEDKNVKITPKVDRSIIGGLKIRIGDKFIDLSVDGKIKAMEKLLAEAV